MGNTRGPYRLERLNAGLLTRHEMARAAGCCVATLDKAQARYIPEPIHPAGPVRLMWHRSEVDAVRQGIARMRAEERCKRRPYVPPAGLLSIGDLAREFDRPRVTLYSWIMQGLFPRGTKRHHGHLWYEVKNLAKLRHAYAKLMQTWGQKRKGG